jgi:hypothetical protein
MKRLTLGFEMGKKEDAKEGSERLRTLSYFQNRISAWCEEACFCQVCVVSHFANLRRRDPTAKLV